MNSPAFEAITADTVYPVVMLALHLSATMMPDVAGVDMGAMLWPVICVAAQQYDLDMGAKETLPTWAVLSLSSTCIMLDAATLLACAQDSPTVLLIITLAHAPLYASMYASHLSYNLWILTKVFVVIFTLRVRFSGVKLFKHGETLHIDDAELRTTCTFVVAVDT